jgi:hypothetical protein
MTTKKLQTAGQYADELTIPRTHVYSAIRSGRLVPQATGRREMLFDPSCALQNLESLADVLSARDYARAYVQAKEMVRLAQLWGGMNAIEILPTADEFNEKDGVISQRRVDRAVVEAEENRA